MLTEIVDYEKCGDCGFDRKSKDKNMWTIIGLVTGLVIGFIIGYCISGFYP